MDEIEYKLRTNNSVFVVNAIDKLISIIKSKFKPAEKKRFALENEELKFLREKCCSGNKLVSLTACQGLLALVELGVLEIGHTMSTVVTLLPSAQNYSAIITTMSGLLILDLRSRLIPGQPYVCQFSLRSPQHPFITVLEKNKAAEDEVLAQMHDLCTNPDYVVSSNSLELLRPVLVWLTCNPERRSIKPWRLLLSLPKSPTLNAILMQCLSCQQTGSPCQVQHAFSAHAAVVESAIYQHDRELVTALVPALAAISHQLVRHGQSPRLCYSLIERCFSLDAPQLRSAAGLALVLLAHNLPHTPAVYLQHLFTTALNIISKYEYSLISLNVFVATSLQWLHLPSFLTSDALKVAAKIIEIQRSDPKDDTRFHTSSLKANKMFETLMHTDSRLSLVFKLNQTWERIRDNPDKLKRWLNTFDSVDDIVKLELVPFLMGITLLNRKEPWWEEVCCKALNIITGLVNTKKELSVQILPLLLYKTANDRCPQVKWLCLKALPLMAVTKENVSTIVTVLNKLKANKTLPTSFLIMLYTSLAETQARCFPYLQEVLSETSSPRPDENKADVEIARALAVLRLCTIRPTSHGVELVGVLSSTLNRCTDSSGAVAARAALLALGELWKGAGVAPAPAWKAISGKVSKDSRIPVQLGVCSLLSVIPSVRSCAEFVDLARAAAALLWRLLAADDPVAGAAALALQYYRIEDYTLKDIPEIYRRTVKLPASYCKTPIDAARDPVDVLDYIPCEIWPEVFKYTCQSALPSVEVLVYKLCEREVKSYRSGVYQHEASNLGHLPPHSVVRGLLEFLRKQATSPSYDFPPASLLSLLAPLSRDAPRALPPLDLCFLHEILHAGAQHRRLVIALAVKQAGTTMSAKRLVENWLQGIGEEAEESDILHFFELLPVLCRTMPPNSIRPPLEKFLGEAYNQVANIKRSENNPKSKRKDSKSNDDDSEEYLFIRMLDLIAKCLENERIHDANRTLLAQVVENYFTVIPEDNVSWPSYVDLCTRLPPETLERMTSPSGWWEVPPPLLYKAGAVRAAVAGGGGGKAGGGGKGGGGGLVWINDLLDAALTAHVDYDRILGIIVKPLMSAQVDDKRTVQWFLQLMARTQVAFTETSDLPSRLFLCSLFSLSAAVFSQAFALAADSDSDSDSCQRARRCVAGDVLPLAVAMLVRRESWRECTPQILDWLRHTRDSPPDVTSSLCCQRALLAMRETQAFTEQRTWITIDKHFSRSSLSAGD